jgi:hypothetical protein
MSQNQRPKVKEPTPDFEPIPGSVPKKSPSGPEPLATQSPKMSPGEDAPDHSGEDTSVESGVTKNDPERPGTTDDETAMQ